MKTVRNFCVAAACLVVLLAHWSTSIGGDFELICQGLSQSGGKANSSNFALCVTSAGQPSMVGSASSASFRQFAGYVSATQVLIGDANGDALVNITDVVYMINYIFGGGPAPNPLPAGDANCDELANISDAVYLISYIFSSGQAPCTDCP